MTKKKLTVLDFIERNRADSIKRRVVMEFLQSMGIDPSTGKWALNSWVSAEYSISHYGVSERGNLEILVDYPTENGLHTALTVQEVFEVDWEGRIAIQLVFAEFLYRLKEKSKQKGSNS